MFTAYFRCPNRRPVNGMRFFIKSAVSPKLTVPLLYSIMTSISLLAYGVPTLIHFHAVQRLLSLETGHAKRQSPHSPYR